MIPARELIERALGHSRAAHCTVVVDDSTETWLRWSDGDLTANGSADGRRVTVLSAVPGGGGTALGSRSATGVGPDGLEALVRAAEAAAGQAPPGGGSVEPLGPGLPGGAGDFAGDATVAVTGGFAGDFADGEPAAPHRLGDLVPALADWQRRAATPLAGFAHHTTVTTRLGSSTGLRLRHTQPTGTLELQARSSDGTRSAWAGTVGPDLGGVDLAALESLTTDRLRRALPYRPLPPGRYEVILPPGAVADLMITAYRVAGADDAVEGRTVFGRPGGGTRLGERLAALPLTLRSDPAEPGLECPPFVLSRGAVSDVFGGAVQAGSDPLDNGLPLGPVDWIRDGVLTSLLTSRAGAARLGLPVRPAVGNLVLDGGGTASLAEMVRTTRRGLLLTCLWYMRRTDAATLSLTGLTRDGVYLVEDGEITAETDDFRFAESPVSLLARATGAGRTERALAREFGAHFPRTAMPPLRIPDFHLTSVSPAARGR
ncbi:metallopeptidase TldD-related protein [Kitasatospora sp. NPDC056651]|uniref:metallopeptidase TldD-related protein n=1 Tax=Kitasatospora sp. NPDC056651 TaxID=3345892 RepID=UPI0036B26EF0